MDNRFIVSASPHLKDPGKSSSVMWWVCIALAPAAAASAWIFGLRALLLIAVCVGTAVLTEALTQLAFKRPVTVADGSATVTGILLAFTLPPATPIWMCVIGSFAAIFLVKQLFGGLGWNVFNPALAARAILLSSFPVAITTWSAPGWYFQAVDSVGAATAVDAVGTASALGIMKEAAKTGAAASMPYGYMNLLLGTVPGSLGETCKIALLIGAALLIAKGILHWRIPAAYLGTVAVLSLVVGRDPLFDLLSGGLILGAFFMATDYVTSPTTPVGRLIFGAGCGLLTFLIRVYGGFPEGVCYAILLMNCVGPLIENATKPRKFGARKPVKGGAR